MINVLLVLLICSACQAFIKVPRPVTNMRLSVQTPVDDEVKSQAMIEKNQLNEIKAEEPKSKFDELKEKVLELGPAGAISLLVETILFWVIFLLPATSYLYHQQTPDGSWLPNFSDTEQVKSYGSVLGGAYVFSKLPPIEVFRWTWAIAMTPMIAERMPDDLTEAMKKGMVGFIEVSYY